jgi:glycerol kinase
MGYWENFEELRSNWVLEKKWHPDMSEKDRSQLLKGWNKAVTRTFDWVE